jgi:signal transduction histidine kinase
MLYEFLNTNRTELIDRCKAKVAERTLPATSRSSQQHGIPIFLDQVIKTLHADKALQPIVRIKTSGGSRPDSSARSEIGATATRHGRELSRRGFTFDQVVRDYGDLCQAVTELASEKSTQIDVKEFRTLNHCLDNAIADAVTEFAYQTDMQTTDRDNKLLDAKLHVLANEMRHHIRAAMLAVTAIKAGNVGLKGVTSSILDLSLVSMQNLVNRCFYADHVTAGLPPRYRIISLSSFIADVKIYATINARARERLFTVEDVDEGLAIDANRELLFSALEGLLDNAFKFSEPHSEVVLRAYAVADRIRIEVEDHCGGLPQGKAEKMLLPFPKGDPDMPGLGLAICRQSVESCGGTLTVQNVPDSGCIFTIDLKRRLHWSREHPPEPRAIPDPTGNA